MSAYERFMSRVDTSQECWVWCGYTNPDGYGSFTSGGKTYRAHRWILAYTLGRELAEDELACHTCDNRSCVRPDHLYPGSHADNNGDIRQRGSRTYTKPSKSYRGLPAHERFMKYVDDSGGPDSCHLWTGSFRSTGYGAFGVDGKIYSAHRWAISQHLGRELSRDEFVLHSCDNPPCVNVAHLSVGTAQQNEADKISKGRHHHAGKTHCSKGHEFTPENTYVRPNGKGRSCRTCKRERAGSTRPAPGPGPHPQVEP